MITALHYLRRKKKIQVLSGMVKLICTLHLSSSCRLKGSSNVNDIYFFRKQRNPCQVFILHKYWHRRRYYSANLTSVSDVQTRGEYCVIFKVNPGQMYWGVQLYSCSVHLYSRNQPTSEVVSTHKVRATAHLWVRHRAEHICDTLIQIKRISGEE